MDISLIWEVQLSTLKMTGLYVVVVVIVIVIEVVVAVVVVVVVVLVIVLIVVVVVVVVVVVILPYHLIWEMQLSTLKMTGLAPYLVVTE